MAERERRACRGQASVLVTGGAGFIGSALVRALCRAGCAVRVLDDFSTGRQDALARCRVELMAGDVRDAQLVNRAANGVDILFHLAGMRAPLPGHRDLPRSEQVNVGGTLNVLEAASVVRPRRVVLVSSGAVYGRSARYVLHEQLAAEPATPDAAQQFAVERYGQMFHASFDVPVVIVRLFRTYGPGEPWTADDAPLVPHWCRAALLGEPRRLHGDGRQSRDFIYVDDAVNGLMAAGLRPGVPGRTYNLASGESVAVRRVWELLAGVARIDPEGVPVQHVSRAPHEPDQVRVSLAAARRDLGFQPNVFLREGLRRTLLFYGDQLRLQRLGWLLPPDPMRRPVRCPPRPAPPRPAVGRPIPPPAMAALGPPPLPSDGAADCIQVRDEDIELELDGG